MKFLRQLRQALDSRLQPDYLKVACGAIVLLCLLMAVLLFATSDQGHTAFGIPLGADFAGFYVAAEILNRDQTEQLYDRKLHQRMYHELLPKEDENDAIPYVHPPFVAGFLRPLAHLRYPIAVAIWLAVTAILYLSATWIVLNSLNWQNSGPSTLLVLLLATSFEPFAFECWLGGQLSAVGYFSYALFFRAWNRNRPVLAGLALGLCFYKPTLLVVVLPLLLVGRCWRILWGMTITGVILATISVLFVGWDLNVGYLGELLAFNKSTAGGDLEIRIWKYVDLNHTWRLLLGPESQWRRPLFALSLLVPFAFLVRAWWTMPYRNETERLWLWAAAIAWTPVLNLYVGIYDSILVVQSALIACSIIATTLRDPHPLTSSGIAYLLAMIHLAPWFSQNLAVLTGVPLYTLLLAGFGTYLVRRAMLATPTLSADTASAPAA